MPKASRKTKHLNRPAPVRPNSTPPSGTRASTSRELPMKRWCFTLNNPTPEELTHIRSVLNQENCDFAVVGNEVGASGTRHLQGFVNMKVKRRLTTMKNWLSERAHFEVARGTDQQNDEYCIKGGDTYLRIGEPVRRGQRSDLQAVVDVAKSTSGSLKAVAEECPLAFIRYGRGIRDYVNVMQFRAPRDFKTRVTVLVGRPGCGKSRMAAQLCADHSTYYKPRGVWWDGYDGQCSVVIDDFYGWMTCDELLRVCDRYPCKVPVKGSFVEFVARNVYITSNRHVWEWYKFEGFIPGAVLRRIEIYKIYDEGRECFVELSESAMFDPLVMSYNY